MRGATRRSRTLAIMIETLPAEWRSALGSRLSDADIRKLDEFVFVERAQAQVFPPDEDVFAALSLTPPDQVRAVILGQAARARPGYTRRLAGGNLSGARSRSGASRAGVTQLAECLLPKHGEGSEG